MLLFSTFRQNPSVIGLRTLIEIYRCRFYSVWLVSGDVHSMSILLMADKTCRGVVVSVAQMKEHRILADMQRAITMTTLCEEANLGCLHC